MIIYTPPRAAEHLPVIDLAPSFSEHRDARLAVAREIGSAARNTGFFYVRNHGVAQSIVDAAFANATAFFDLPHERKIVVRKTPGSRGYEPLETRGLDPASPPDIKESFNFEPDVGPPQPDAPGNRWPDKPAGFRRALESYYDGALGLGRHLLRLLALSLDEPETCFDEAFRTPSAALSLLRYPPQPSDAAFNQLGAGAHNDWGGITVLAQDDKGGLEVQSAAGDWLRAAPIAGTFVVNLGDLMARWTNDVYHSSLHRVMNNVSGTNRQSIVLFLNPAYDTQVECLPSCRAECGGTVKYAPCIAGEHIAELYRASRERSVPSEPR
jgi:isopenicillin N synthase-like dioxygenase